GGHVEVQAPANAEKTPRPAEVVVVVPGEGIELALALGGVGIRETTAQKDLRIEVRDLGLELSLLGRDAFLDPLPARALLEEAALVDLEGFEPRLLDVEEAAADVDRRIEIEARGAPERPDRDLLAAAEAGELLRHLGASDPEVEDVELRDLLVTALAAFARGVESAREAFVRLVDD